MDLVDEDVENVERVVSGQWRREVALRLVLREVLREVLKEKVLRTVDILFDLFSRAVSVSIVSLLISARRLEI